MLEGLVAHCVTQWQRRLSRILHAAPMADFLGGFFPPAPAGKAPLRLTNGRNDGRAARLRDRQSSPPAGVQHNQWPHRGFPLLGAG